MKRIATVLSLLIGLVQNAGATTAPKLTAVHRVETAAAFQGQSQLIEDPRGQPILVAVQEIPNEKQLLEVVAFNSSGQRIAATKIWYPHVGHFLHLEEVGFNSSGEIVATILNSPDGSSSGTLSANNLTKNSSAILLDVGNYIGFGGRVQAGGRSLALVTADLGRGPNNSYPTLVRVVDEANGEIIQQKIFDQSTSAKIGADSQGNVKILLMGYKVFSLFDVKAGTVTDLLPPPSQLSAYPGVIRNILGEFIQVDDKNKLSLYKFGDLLNGNAVPRHTFPTQTTFAGPKPEKFALIKTIDGIEVRNLLTGKSEGPAIPSRVGPRSYASIESLLETSRGLLAVTAAVKNPRSFSPGTILNVIDVSSGKVLHHSEDDDAHIAAYLMETPTGSVIATEVKQPQLLSGPARVQVVDLADDHSLNQLQEVLIGVPFLSGSGRVVGLHENGSAQLCVQDLLETNAESCIQEPLVNSLVQYGHQPFAIEPGKLRLPLLQGPAMQVRKLGYVDLSVE